MASVLGIGNALTDILAVLPDDTFLKQYHLPRVILRQPKSTALSLTRASSRRQDYVALLRFPFPSHGLSYTNPKARPAIAGLLFSHGPLPYESELSTVECHTKKALNIVECFWFGVIRTGFEPVTHSLEGCCSIQLSYRTSPIEGAKICFLAESAK